MRAFGYFFLCFGYHPALHSFPTRRSSDLVGHVFAREQAAAVDPRSEIGRDGDVGRGGDDARGQLGLLAREDRKSTRLNSSHVEISYAVFCLKTKSYNRFALEQFLYLCLCT